MSSPVWQFQMGDPEALNSAEPRARFVALHHGSSIVTAGFTAAAIMAQIFMARLL